MCHNEIIDWSYVACTPVSFIVASEAAWGRLENSMKAVHYVSPPIWIVLRALKTLQIPEFNHLLTA